MTYDVQKYDTATAIHQTDCDEWVKAHEAEAHEAKAVLHEALRWEAEYRELRERTIKECIAAVEAITGDLTKPTNDWRDKGIDDAISVLRSLLEREQK